MITADILQKLICETPEYEPAEEPKAPDNGDFILLENDHPDTIAKAFRKWSVEHCGVIHKYNCNDGWSIYHKNRYQKVQDEAEIEGYIRNFVANEIKIKSRKKNEDGGYDEITVRPDKQLKSRGSIINIMVWLRDMPGVHLRPGQKAPCSLDGNLDPKHIIAVNNGLLDVTNAHRPVLLPHTPEFYTFNYLPYNYEPAATCATWDRVLGEYFMNDDGTPDSLVPNILHSWIKKWLLRDTTPHKIFVLVGQKRSGKGTMGRVINQIVGEKNVAPMTISQLSKSFGLQPLLNKQLGIIWDAAIGDNNSNTKEAVEILKCISGNDPFTVDRKNREQLTNISLQMSVLIICNKVLDLRDSTGALAGRFTFLETTGSFYGHEDHTIEEQLKNELSGIFNRVIAAPEGRVMEHPKSEGLQHTFEELSSPYIAFLNDWCEVGDDDLFIPTDIFWLFFCRWAEQNNHHKPSKQKFKLEFHGSHKSIKRDYRPQLNFTQQMAILDKYFRQGDLDANGLDLDANRKFGINLGNRPCCYRGVDVKEEYRNARK